MTDLFDLDDLKNSATPKPDDAARQKAALAAVSAFDAHHMQKKSAATQESQLERRPKKVNTSFWSSMMSSLNLSLSGLRMGRAPLAGALLLPIATVSGLYVYTNLDGAGDETSPSTVQLEDAGSGKPDKAPDGQNAVLPTPPVAKLAPPAPSPAPALRGRSDIAPASGQRRSFAERSTGLRPMHRKAGEGVSLSVPVQNRDRNTTFEDGRTLAVAEHTVSTFSADVDTASYARVRRTLMGGNLPPRDMVRVEEMINYFSYDYPLPDNRQRPFKPTVTVMPTPWNESGTQLMHIGIKGFDVVPKTRPKANLVFLLDVSGSMRSADRLPLLVKSFRLLLQKLRADDTISIVTYAGRSGTLLPPTKVSDRSTIMAALDRVTAGGGTAGEAGLQQAYRLAAQSFVEGGINRVLLATDGDFNVGLRDPEDLKRFIARKRETGISLSVFGFGRGNTNDALMQALAQNGNGVAAYIDTLAEAQKVMVEQAGGTLFTIASDVKFQVEFNPATVAEYRLVGYETRALRREDFNNDAVDAGEIGSGHSVTAIYEITPVGSKAVLNDPLKYGSRAPAADGTASQLDEIATLKMRYKLPGHAKSELVETVVRKPDPKSLQGVQVSDDVRFSVAVSAFAQKLRGSLALKNTGYDAIHEWAQKARGRDRNGFRSEFLKLVRLASALHKSEQVKPSTQKQP